jgi:hypothetical protein
MVGIPLGFHLIRKMRPETFRRICMSFDAWIVGFGLSRVLIEVRLIESPMAYAALLSVMLIDSCLLWRFFSTRRAVSEYSAAVGNAWVRKK